MSMVLLVIAVGVVGVGLLDGGAQGAGAGAVGEVVTSMTAGMGAGTRRSSRWLSDAERTREPHGRDALTGVPMANAFDQTRENTFGRGLTTRHERLLQEMAVQGCSTF